MQDNENAVVVYPCSRLSGEIRLQGSKNSVLPIMAAALLKAGVTVLENCPDIADVHAMSGLLKKCGCRVEYNEHVMRIDASAAANGILDDEYSSKMRASILLMGSCLGRFGRFVMPPPGGCAIGKRPIDFHVSAMRQLGADISGNSGGVDAYVGGHGLMGCDIRLPFPSVGATQNCLIAAMGAKGSTRIFNASSEPEVWDLCCYLRMLVAQIEGERTGNIEITPPPVINSEDIYYTVPADRIVAGTILVAAAGCTGNVYIPNIECDRIQSVIKYLGAHAAVKAPGVVLNTDRRKRLECAVSTGPFPEFPTDMQSQFLALMAVSGNFCIMEENVFDTRFKAAYELNRLGADIRIEGRTAYVYGRRHLHGGTVTASDLRGGAALVLAGLFADEPVTVRGCEYIRRGYENLSGDLRELGARIYECSVD